jgi:hypothetical protein
MHYYSIALNVVEIIDYLQELVCYVCFVRVCKCWCAVHQLRQIILLSAREEV